MLILWPLNTQILQENACHEVDMLLDKKSRLTTSSLNCSSVESLLMENSRHFLSITMVSTEGPLDFCLSPMV